MTHWRSLQYVPAHVPKYVNSQHLLSADAVILDLEDSVPEGQKLAAREAIASAVELLRGRGPDLMVRINASAVHSALDIGASVLPGVTALVVPKLSDIDDVARIDTLISQAERSNGVLAGSVKVFALIETARGYLNMQDILQASPRIVAVSLGNEDFATDIGMVPDAETLTLPRQQMVIVAAACGVTPLGLIGEATAFADLEAYRSLAARSRRFGFRGSTCIHPSQIAVLNETFSPSKEEISWASAVVSAAEDAEAQGRGAAALDGQMIDQPIVTRAREMLRLMSSAHARNNQTSL